MFAVFPLTKASPKAKSVWEGTLQGQGHSERAPNHHFYKQPTARAEQVSICKAPSVAPDAIKVLYILAELQNREGRRRRVREGEGKGERKSNGLCRDAASFRV